MPQQRSKTRAVIPGKAILGVIGAKVANRKTMGGAVVPGRAILGDQSDVEQQKLLAAQKVEKVADPKQATGPKPAAPKADDSGLPPLIAPRAIKKGPPAPPPSLSEGQVAFMLDADPDAWEHILDLEAERPDGMRPAVAAAILKVKDRMTHSPLDEAAIEALEVVAGQAK